MSGLSLIILALVCELAGVFFLFPAGGTGASSAAFFLLHPCGCILFAKGMPAVLPADRRLGKRPWLMIISFTFFIPLFGAMGLGLILLYLRLAGKKGLRPEFFSIPQLPFASVENVRPVSMGEAGAWSRLREESAPRHVKLEALMAAGAATGQNASRLLRMATGDIDDEIRLVAFNFFEKREKRINVSINQLLSALKEEEEDRKKGNICAKLAFAYWEFVYNELARAELRDFYLDQALYHARLAGKLSGESHLMSMLIGRIQLRRGEVEEAERAVNRALELGASPDKVVPFKAEVFYLKRDFDALKQLLAEHSSLRHKPGIGAVVSFWTEA